MTRWLRAPAALASLVAVGCAATDGTPDVQAPELTVTETLRIGSVDDPETALTTVRGVEIAEDGTIFTLHRREIGVFSPGGTRLGRYGARGDGPGEYQSAQQMVMADGELRILDTGLSRITRLGLDGSVLGVQQVRPRQIDHPVLRGPRPTHLLADMSMVGTYGVNQVREGWADWYERELPDVRFAPQGGEIDTIAVRSLVGRGMILHLAEPTTTGSPYGFDPLLDVSPIRLEAVVVDRGVRPEEPVMSVTRVMATGDTIWRRVVPYQPVPIDHAYVDSFVVALSDQLETIGFATRREGEAEIRNRMVIPEHAPPVDRVRLGIDGSVWLQLADRDPIRTRWLVLDPDGDVLGMATLPHRFRVIRASTTAVWGQGLDDLDVPYVVRYAVSPTSPRQPGAS